jgi:hypothetical protein
MMLVIALGKDGRYPALSRALLGLEALAMVPYVEGRGREGVADAGPEPTGPERPAFSARFRPAMCPLCVNQAPLDQGVLSLYHLALVCKHPPIAAWRMQLTASVPALLRTLVAEGKQALRGDPWAGNWAAPSPAQEAALEALLAGAPALPLSFEHRVLLHRLLLAAPWPAAAVRHADHHGMACLGSLFDALNVKPHLLRTWASTWLEWAEGQLQSLAVAFKRAQRP